MTDTDKHNFEALRADDESRLTFWRNTDPKCPHCGGVCNIANNEWYDLSAEGEHAVTCSHCEGDFSVSTHVAYKFSTNEQEGVE